MLVGFLDPAYKAEIMKRFTILVKSLLYSTAKSLLSNFISALYPEYFMLGKKEYIIEVYAPSDFKRRT